MNEHDALKVAMEYAGEAMAIAVEAAKPASCAKSNRSVIIWKDWGGRLILKSTGYNHPPAPFACDGSDACRAACSRVCVHAEAHALLQVDKFGPRGASMLHVKVVDGKAVSSGPPSCVRCSALILEAGIAWMWLLHDDGLKRYSAEEFHQLGLEHHGLPVHRG